MSDMESTTPVDPPTHRRGRWRRLVILGAVAMCVALGAPFLISVVKPDPLWLSRSLGCCPVDKVHASPSGTYEIRVFITDGGATGYGGISVYQKQSFGRYRLLWQDDPVVAIPDTHSVKWVAENKLELRYENPYGGAQSDVLKVLTLN